LFPALLAHEVLNPIWAVAAPFWCWHGSASSGDIHRAVKAPEYRNGLVSSHPDHEAKHG
jgi:hypothetical protein